MGKKFEIVRCRDCVFFTHGIAFEDGNEVGHCQRFPPQGRMKTATSPNFGTTLSNWWCGEGRKADE